MHSSRMRTGRTLTVCRGDVCFGGVPAPGGCVYLCKGCVCFWGWGCLLLGLGVVSASGGCLLLGVSASGGWGVVSASGGWGVVSASGGVASGSVCFWSWGVCMSQHAMGQTPPCGQTHTCKNITLATTSLRPVKNYVTIMFHKMAIL